MRFPQCEQLELELKGIKSLKAEFDLEYQKALETGNLEKVKKLKAELEQKGDALREKLWPFEFLPSKELKEQYESQRAILIKAGILEKLSSGELGIKAIDGKESAFPSYHEITGRMRENQEILKSKTEQGFNQLLIVPFGMKLDDLIEKYRQVILKHHREGKLLATKEKSSDPNEPLELDEKEPVWVWDPYQDADRNETLVYFPKEFSKNHQGKTKQEILQQTKQGFNILLLENLPNIPRQGKGKEIKARKQLEAGKTPNQYLKALKTNPMYKNESGMTPEEQITYAIRYLEENNQVIDDYSGKGSVSYQLGAFFTVGGNVPRAHWGRGSRRVLLGGDVSEYSASDAGVRGAVRV